MHGALVKPSFKFELNQLQNYGFYSNLKHSQSKRAMVWKAGKDQRLCFFLDQDVEAAWIRVHSDET